MVWEKVKNEGFEVKVTERLYIESGGEGVGVDIVKRNPSGKDSRLVLSSEEFAILHRAMEVVEPFLYNQHTAPHFFENETEEE